MNNVIKADKPGEKLFSIIEAAYVYSVLKIILYYRMRSCYNEVLYKILKQRLISDEEKSSKN